MNFAERYADCFTPEPNSGCWLWLRGCTRAGYGRIGKSEYAHRLSFESVHGIGSAKGVEVRHTCDTPCCVNPDHLLGGTHADNMQDMVVRNRQNHFVGNGIKTAILTDKLVEDIRQRAATGELGTQIARTIGVSKEVVRAAASGDTWSHVSTPPAPLGRKLGSKNPQAKLNEESVREIKRRLPFESQERLAAVFGVSRGAIKHIVSGRNWSHVKSALEQIPGNLWG